MQSSTSNFYFAGEIDDNFLRRFEYQIFCGPPEEHEVLDLLKFFAKNYHHAVSDKEFGIIANLIYGVTQDYIKTLTKMAYHNAVQKVLSTTHIYRVRSSLKILPCPANFPGSYCLPFTAIPEQLIFAPPIVFDDYRQALGPFSHNPEDGYIFDLFQFKEFARKMGRNSMQCVNFPL